MKAKFIYESIESYLKPKSNDEILNILSTLSEEELYFKLIDATKNGLSDIVQYLIKAGADVNYGVNVNFSNKVGWTPLHCASLYNHKQIVKILIDAGANVNIKDNSGWTPLHYASRDGYNQIVKILLNAGANVNAKTDIGETALYLAGWNNHTGITNLLRKHGAK